MRECTSAGILQKRGCPYDLHRLKAFTLFQMRRLSPILSAVFLSAAAALAAGNAATTPVDGLSQAEMDRALDAIWLKTPRPEQRSPESAKRAALQAYLTRLGPGVGLFEAAPEPLSEDDFPALRFHSEVLAGKTAYVRLGAFNAELPVRVEAALRDFAQLGARSLILDLRATPAEGTLRIAAELSGHFLPKGAPIFSLRTSVGVGEPLQSQDPEVERFQILILTGVRTAGPVEAFAAALRARLGATLIGAPTQGQAADFELIALGENRFLRLPSAEATLPEEPDLFPKGLKADIPFRADAEDTDAALLYAAKEGRVAPLLQETERPRLNEAALVEGRNPETEAWIEAQLNRSKPKPPRVPRDLQLNLAMDFLRAWDGLHGQAAVQP